MYSEGDKMKKIILFFLFLLIVLAGLCYCHYAEDLDGCGDPACGRCYGYVSGVNNFNNTLLR